MEKHGLNSKKLENLAKEAKIKFIKLKPKIKKPKKSEK